MSNNAITVDSNGSWKPFPTLAEYKKANKDLLCDMDKVAVAVLEETEETGYKIQTSLENFCCMVKDSLDDDILGGGITSKDDFSSNVEKIRDYLYDQRGHFNDFDYVA